MTRKNDKSKKSWKTVPTFPSSCFDSTVMELYLALNASAKQIFIEIAEVLRIDPQFLLDLTDIDIVGSDMNDFCCDGTKCEENTVEQNGKYEVKESGNANDFVYSSSLLRICKYVANINKLNGIESSLLNRPHHVVFGAHTDTSFLTIALLSSTPGLQIVDQSTIQWVSPEIHTEAVARVEGDSTCVHEAVVFVGEFLQVLTGGVFTAAVHRVVGDRSFPSSSSSFNDKAGDECIRVSCPYIIRGFNKAIIDFKGAKYSHPFEKDMASDAGVSTGSEPNLSESVNHESLDQKSLAAAHNKLASYDGITMKMLHMLLEMKRKRCFHKNSSKSSATSDEDENGENGEWVLSSFPVSQLPMEDNSS
mmetsp:Transcript_27159/g.37426  ORF Transcript_27159/g.37426 Transcript_27159/m.37426 type:complete len:363 (+) Transcript_27159:205-1293(+)